MTTDIIKGTGGSVTFLLADAAHMPTGLVTFDVSVWRIDDSSIPADVSHVGREGTTYASKGQYEVAWSLVLPEDFARAPEKTLLRAGSFTNVWLKTGDRDYWHRIEGTKISTVSTTDASTGDVIRAVITGVGGDVIYYSATPPATPGASPPALPATPGTSPEGSGGTGLNPL